LSIVDGLGANIAALSESGQNITNGIGYLQTADGALSQVTTILNSAVSIATEASTGGLTGNQATALSDQFAAILAEINQIGSTTNFNGQSVFAGNTSEYLSTQASLATSTALTNGSKTSIYDATTGGTFVYTAGASSTVATLQTAIAAAVSAGTLSAGTALTLSSGQVEIANSNSHALQVSTNDAVMGPFNPVGSGNSTANVFTSDGTASGAYTLGTVIGALSSATLGLSTQSLSTTTAAQSALQAVTAAIGLVALQRGELGANINSLTSSGNVENTEVQNLQSAQNGVQNADIAKVTSNLSQENVLEQTGFAALQQSQAVGQNVLKLLQ